VGSLIRAVLTTAAAWPDLPEAIKAGIVAMVRAAPRAEAIYPCESRRAETNGLV
jgi:hypothetical protein